MCLAENKDQEVTCLKQLRLWHVLVHVVSIIACCSGDMLISEALVELAVPSSWHSQQCYRDTCTCTECVSIVSRLIM